MKYVIGNWKSNGSLKNNATLLEAVRGLSRVGVAVGVCVPYPYLAQAQALLAGSEVGWGAQNLSPFGAGAYTGEVTAEMIAEFGARYVIVGHSERRQYFAETDAMIADKIANALKAGLTPIWCIGETLTEREIGRWQEVLAQQLTAVLERLGPSFVSRAIIAYEPVWAIGTGRNATAQDIEAAHAWIREVLSRAGAACDVPVLYGGSVKAANAREIFATPGCDGGLIGGASLLAEEFAAIVAAAD